MTRPPAAKRLTYVVNYLSADDAQHFVHIPNLLAHLERLGWRIDLVSERGGHGIEEVLGRQVTFLSRSSKVDRAINLARHLIRMRRSGGRLVFVRISKFAAFGSALLGRLLGWKTVYWLSGTVEDFNLRRGLSARIGFAGMWLLFRWIDRLATGPETMVRYYADIYGLPASKIMLLYNDVALGGTSAASRHRDPAEARVLLVHRLSPVRETARYFPALLDALAPPEKSAAALDVCGDGPERSELEAIASGAAATIRFHGAVAQRELRSFYDHASIFVMPSYREGFPRVMLEAMAHGLPIVATDAGGTRDLCGPLQKRYVVDRDDAAAFGAAVSRLLASPEEQCALAAENREWVRRFDTPVVARMYDRALSDLIGLQPAA